MRKFCTAVFLAAQLACGPLGYADIASKNGIPIGPQSILNGATPNSAINGATIAPSAAFFYNIASSVATSASTAEPTHTWGAPITANKTGSCTKVSVRYTSTNTGLTLKAALYNSSLGLLGSGSAVFTTSTNIDVEVTLGTAVSVTALTLYYVLFTPSSNTAGSHAFQPAFSGAGKFDGSNGYSTFPLATALVTDSSNRPRVGMLIVPAP